MCTRPEGMSCRGITTALHCMHNKSATRERERERVRKASGMTCERQLRRRIQVIFSGFVLGGVVEVGCCCFCIPRRRGMRRRGGDLESGIPEDTYSYTLK
jgi:hypothetical protein